jgi:pilus assembly protein CpaB
MSTMRRLLAVLTALALAVFGAVVLVAYVHGADARAEAGAVLVPVLVVDTDVPAGTAAEDVAGSVSTVQVPQRLVATGAIGDLTEVAGLTTTATLLAGDQVMAARFGDPTVQSVGGAPVVPVGMQEVSLSLDPQRAVGGALAPGDRVGVYISAAGTDPTAAPRSGTDLAVGQVLVTRVSGGSESAALTVAGTGTGTAVTVTLALGQADAATVIGGMELGTVWLSLQSSAVSADTSGDSTAQTTGANQ